MNLITSQLNKPLTMTQTNTSVVAPKEVKSELKQSDENISSDKKDLFTKNRIALAAAAAIVLGGIAYAALSRGKTTANEPQTHIERINAFGQKIIEDLNLSPNGKIISKEIASGENKYTAIYTDGKLTSVDDYIPLASETLKDEKYSTLKSIIDEIQAKLVVFQDLGESKNYYLFDSKGEKVTEVNEYPTDPKAMYQYLTMKLSPDKKTVYEIADIYSPKENAAFAEIFENFKP